MEDKKYPIGGFAPGNSICKCVSCKENFVGDKRAVQCEPCAEKENTPYWKSLKQKYEIPLPDKSFEEALDDEIIEWFEKDREQSKYLIEKYGSCAWRINELANTLRNEEISESHFRELVRYCLDEHFKNFAQKEVKQKLKDEYNKYNSWLRQETQFKMGKGNPNLIRETELRAKVDLLKELIEKL